MGDLQASVPCGVRARPVRPDALAATLRAALDAPLGIAPGQRQPSCQRLRMLPGGDGAELHAEPSRCPKADPIGRGRAIAGGAALRNLELAVAGLGRVPVVRPLPDPGEPLHLATLTLGADRACGEGGGGWYDGAAAVAGGSTDPWPAARWLRQAAESRAGVHALPVEGDRLRTVGTVLAAALSHRRHGEDHLADVAQWLRPTAPGSSSVSDGSGDGSGDRSGDRDDLGGPGGPGGCDLGDAGDLGGRGGLRGLCGRGDRGVIIERLDRGVLILLTTDADRPLDWLHAGHALQGAWLAARDLGLVPSAVGGVLDAPGVRAALAVRLRLTGCPQLLLHAAWP